jgi:hypothetical protein
MTWYRAKPGFEDGTTYLNTLGTPVRYWSKEKCEVLHRTPANSNCIINGGIIHDLENSQSNRGSRICYSLILQDLETKKWLSWGELVGRLKEFLY